MVGVVTTAKGDVSWYGAQDVDDVIAAIRHQLPQETGLILDEYVRGYYKRTVNMVAVIFHHAFADVCKLTLSGSNLKCGIIKASAGN
jgi:hypothetical protein